MISLDILKPYFPFEPPAYFEDIAKDYIPEKEPMPLVSDEEFAAVEEATEMDKACFDRLKEVNALLFADKERNTAARFLRHVLTVARNPWENHIYAPTMFTIPDVPVETVDLLFVTAALAHTLIVRKPPMDLNRENINAYRGYTNGFTSKNGYWGISERNWNLLCAGGCMFLFNTLKFQPESFCDDYLVLTDGKEYKTIVIREFGVSAEGFLTKYPEKTVFKTSYEETDTAYLAHEVRPNATVEPERKTFEKSVWSLALSKKDMVLGFHIPSDKPYTVEEHRKSMKLALDFYKEFYPNANFKAFVCYSWLYSAQNKFVLPETSRILEIQRHVHLCPMLYELDETLRFVRQGSALSKKIAEFRASGGNYHVGYMYVPNSEAEVFGEFTHEL